mmetsp:Transcript_53779/g.154408  ORF Transcript_53779/g.154408 Transcript_53779/m.154408 type:complete len:232 (-) Transcript_53779:336-1031(-)
MFGTKTLFKTAWPNKMPQALNASALVASSSNQYVLWSLHENILTPLQPTSADSPAAPALLLRKLRKATLKNSFVTPGPMASSPANVTRRGRRSCASVSPSKVASRTSINTCGSLGTSKCSGWTRSKPAGRFRSASCWMCSQMSHNKQTRRKLTGTKLLCVKKEQKSRVSRNFPTESMSGTLALGCFCHRLNSDKGSHLLMPSRMKRSYSTLGPLEACSSSRSVPQTKAFAE